MEVFIDLRDPDAFPMSAGFPDNYRGVNLKDAFVLSGKNSLGEIVLQKYTGPGFSIQFGSYQFYQAVHCVLNPPDFSTGSIMALKNNLKSRIEEIGSLAFKEGQFALLDYGQGSLQQDFKAHAEYHILQISCSYPMLGQILSFFPRLLEMVQKNRLIHSAFIVCPQQKAGKKSLSLVNDILNSPFHRGTNEEAFAHKVREYLWELMLTSEKSYPKIRLNQEEETRIRALAEQLRLQPYQWRPIQTLSRQVGMSETKLKLAFKYFFGKGVFEYGLDRRMEESQRMLREGILPIKKIASLVGYEQTTSFITKFREYFGYPPSRIQNRK